MHLGLALRLMTIGTAASVTQAALCGCSKDVALRITNIYENSDTEFHYDYCEDLGDGRGFTAGIAGFCTGTSDAWEVIQEYHKLTGGSDEFSEMDDTLQKYSDSGSDSTSGLDGYCKTWEKLGKSDIKFQQAQDNIRDQMYFVPSQKYADELGLKFDITRGQLYDTGIEHGTGDDADGLGALIKSTNAGLSGGGSGESGSTLTIDGTEIDEIEWLKKFIEIRVEDLKNPKEEDNQGGDYWAQTTYRTDSYSYMIEQGEYSFGKSVKLLDNDGNPTSVSCEGSNNRRRRRRDSAGRPRRRFRKLSQPKYPPTSRRPRPPLSKKQAK